MTKIKDKENNKGKAANYLWGILIRLLSEFFAEILQTRRECHDVFKVMKEATTKNTLPSKADSTDQKHKQAKAKRIQHHQTNFATNAKGTSLGRREKATTRLLWWLRLYRICLQGRKLRFDPWIRKIPWRRKW